MSETQAIQAWKNSALEDFSFSKELFESGKFSHSLFFLHLAVDKNWKRLL